MVYLVNTELTKLFHDHQGSYTAITITYSLPFLARQLRIEFRSHDLREGWQRSSIIN
jgi:hypothetical protein